MEPATPTPTVDGFRAALRTRGWAVDVAAAMVVGVIGAVSKPTISFATGPQTTYSLIVFGCVAAMLFRRRRPRLTLSTMGLLLVVDLLLVGELSIFALVVCVIAAYTAQARLATPWRWVFLTAAYVGATAAVLTWPAAPLNTDWRQRAIVVTAVCAVLTVAALAGVLRRNARARYDLAIEQAVVLQAQQDTERRVAVLEERNRIAREMHDILAHSLNVIAVQAEGARYALTTDPDRAGQALADIGRLSRSAVDEVRDLIDVLRTQDEAADPHPMPSLGDVPELIGTFQLTGAVIRLHLTGQIDNVPGHVSLAAYRVIQESLTNAIKHASHAPIIIRTTIGTDCVDVLIANGAPSRLKSLTVPGRGHGLIGMQERTHALDGTFEAGPDPATGGWHVAAHLPWDRP